jgi:hypothetical protein
MYYVVFNSCILFSRKSLLHPGFLYIACHILFSFVFVLGHVIQVSAGEFCSLFVVLFARNVKTPSSFLFMTQPLPKQHTIVCRDNSIKSHLQVSGVRITLDRTYSRTDCAGFLSA